MVNCIKLSSLKRLILFVTIFSFLIHDWAARWQCYNAPLFPQISSFLVATTIVLGCTPDTSQSNIHWKFFPKVKFAPSREYDCDEWRRDLIPFSWSTTSMYVLCLDPTSPFCFLVSFSLLAKENCSWKPLAWQDCSPSCINFCLSSRIAGTMYQSNINFLYLRKLTTS